MRKPNYENENGLHRKYFSFEYRYEYLSFSTDFQINTNLYHFFTNIGRKYSGSGCFLPKSDDSRAWQASGGVHNDSDLSGNVLDGVSKQSFERIVPFDRGYLYNHFFDGRYFSVCRKTVSVPKEYEVFRWTFAVCRNADF